MRAISRFFRRIRFRRTISADESKNVVDGIVKARKLYKKLSIAAHPDRNIEKKDIADELMQQIVANKHNYEMLLKLEKEVEEKLK